MKVAVTGVGGGVGQSVMKALSISKLAVEVYAIDVQPFSAGLYRASKSVVLPRLESPGAAPKWEQWLVENGVTALIPGSDHDVLPLASVRDDWAARGICRVLVSDIDLVHICRDKASTIERLRAHGIPVPDSAWDLTVESALIWAKQHGYPLVLKPRDGYASRHVNVIKDDEELIFHFRRTPNPIIQEHLGDFEKAEEFTCAVFVDRSRTPKGCFMARRDLSGGATYRAEVVFEPEIQKLLEDIGKTMRPLGPLNVQLRMTKRGPVPFELNVRCSGTAAIRAYFGYNEPEMLLRHYILGEELVPVVPRKGYALRYWNEVFIDGADHSALERGPGGLKGRVLAWP